MIKTSLLWEKYLYIHSCKAFYASTVLRLLVNFISFRLFGCLVAVWLSGNIVRIVSYRVEKRRLGSLFVLLLVSHFITITYHSN